MKAHHRRLFGMSISVPDRDLLSECVRNLGLDAQGERGGRDPVFEQREGVLGESVFFLNGYQDIKSVFIHLILSLEAPADHHCAHPDCVEHQELQRGHMVKCEGFCGRTMHQHCWGYVGNQPCASTAYKHFCGLCITHETKSIEEARQSPSDRPPSLLFVLTVNTDFCIKEDVLQVTYNSFAPLCLFRIYPPVARLLLINANRATI